MGAASNFGGFGEPWEEGEKLSSSSGKTSAGKKGGGGWKDGRKSES